MKEGEREGQGEEIQAQKQRLQEKERELRLRMEDLDRRERELSERKSEGLAYKGKGRANDQLILESAGKEMQASEDRLTSIKLRQLEKRKIPSPITPEGLRAWSQLTASCPEPDRRLLLENALPSEGLNQLTDLGIPGASAEEAIKALIEEFTRKLPSTAGPRLAGEEFAQFFLREVGVEARGPLTS